MSNFDAQPLLDPLTERELDILRLIAEGLSNREIAQELVITLGTVKWYNKQIYSKLDVGSRTQAVAKAQQHHLLDEQQDTPVFATPSPAHNLPAQITSFVGREREITEVKELLEEKKHATLKTTCLNQHGEKVLDGEAIVSPPRALKK